MAISNQRRLPPRPPQRDDYLPSFVIHTLQLLKLGYDRLNPAEFATEREETITGCLTAAMKSVLRSRTAPEWTADLTVHDEAHLEDGIRRGKRRLRIDIEFEQVRRGPRPIFQFEAKRLRSAASVHAYLGPGGLGCFLDGRYAKDQGIAGMLGYTQSGTVGQRAAQLAGKLDNHRSTLSTGYWHACALVPALPTYQTRHQRTGRLGPITILHSLLTFC